MTNNLIYHVFATNTEMMWWNLKNIRKHLSIFNGKRIFTIAKKHKFDTKLVDKIINFLGTEHQYFILDNNIEQMYGGTYPFFELSAPLIANTNQDEFLFHGHTKGATYDVIKPSILFWTDMMYEVNLRNYENLKSVLTNYDAFGILKCEGIAFGNRVRWHYPGAFWWVRNSSLFSHNWKAVERDACATEILPAQFISTERAYDGGALPYQFFDPNKPYAADKLYDEDCWKSYFNTQDLTPFIGNTLYADL